MRFSQFVNYFVALLVIANPLSALPAVLRITRHQPLGDKRRTGLISAFAVGVILISMTWFGTTFLQVLGIRLAAFQVAGGVVVFLMALAMLNAEESSIKQSPDEQGKKSFSDSGAIVPLAIPIIAGPGAISTVIVTVGEFPGMLNHLILSASALLVAIVMGFLLYFASNVEKVLGQAGVNIINRIGGLILMAIAVQNLATGVLTLFPGLAG